MLRLLKNIIKNIVNVFCLLPAVDFRLDDVGLSFVKNSISAVETRGELQTNGIMEILKSSVRGIIRFFIWLNIQEEGDTGEQRRCSVLIYAQGGSLSPVLKPKGVEPLLQAAQIIPLPFLALELSSYSLAFLIPFV